MAVDFVQNLLLLTLSLFFVRFLQTHFLTGTLSSAVAYIYH